MARFLLLHCAALTGLFTRNPRFQGLTPLAISWRPFGAPEAVLVKDSAPEVPWHKCLPHSKDLWLVEKEPPTFNYPLLFSGSNSILGIKRLIRMAETMCMTATVAKTGP